MRIQLIGPMRVQAGEEIRLPGPRPSALLAMLVLAPGGAVPRAVLADRFWGEKPEAQAGASLRQTLYALRQALGPAGGRIGGAGGLVTFDLSGVAIDLVAERARPPAFGAEARARLIRLSRQEVLEGLALNAQGVEDWLRAEREAWRGDVAGLMRAASAAAFEARDWDAARELAEAMLAADPFCEETMGTLLRIDAARAGPLAMRRRFESFRTTLRTELGVDPSEAVAALMRDLDRAGTGGRDRPRAARREPPVAEILWPDDGTGARATGFAAAARSILVEELNDLGIRVFLAMPDGPLPVPAGPARAYRLRGEILAFARENTLVLELVSPERQALASTRIGFRWPLDLAQIEPEIARRARTLGQGILSHAGLSAAEEAPGTGSLRRAELAAAIGAAALAADPPDTAAVMQPGAEGEAAPVLPPPHLPDLDALTGFPALALTSDLPGLPEAERRAHPAGSEAAEPDLFRFADAGASGPAGHATLKIGAAAPLVAGFQPQTPQGDYALVTFSASWGTPATVPAQPANPVQPEPGCPHDAQPDFTGHQLAERLEPRNDTAWYPAGIESNSHAPLKDYPGLRTDNVIDLTPHLMADIQSYWAA